MNTKTIAIVVAILLVGVVGAAIGISSSGNTVTGNIVLPIGKDILEGRITNVQVSPGIIEGVSAYDRNCVGTHMWTECDGGIRTEEYGVLNFHYSHNMMEEPCIHMNGPEKLYVEILDSSGTAKVYRA